MHEIIFIKLELLKVFTMPDTIPIFSLRSKGFDPHIWHPNF